MSDPPNDRRRRGGANTTVSITVHLDKATLSRTDDEVVARNGTRSALVRAALTQYFTALDGPAAMPIAVPVAEQPQAIDAREQPRAPARVGGPGRKKKTP